MLYYTYLLSVEAAPEALEGILDTLRENAKAEIVSVEVEEEEDPEYDAQLEEEEEL